MMAEIKWIKMATDLFDNRKIKQIECLPEGDAIIVIWMKLLCLSGSINDRGFVYFTKDIPYTEQMLSTQFGRPLSTIQLAISTFERFGMVEIIDDVLCISNWEKYQNIDRMEEIREYNRLAKQRSRAKKKAEIDVNDKSMTSQRCHDTEVEVEVDKDKEVVVNLDTNILNSETDSKSASAPAHAPSNSTYDALCKKYGKDFVDERVERAKKYKNISMSKVAEWCEADFKNQKGRKGSKNQFNNYSSSREYDFDRIERERRC